MYIQVLKPAYKFNFSRMFAYFKLFWSKLA